MKTGQLVAAAIAALIVLAPMIELAAATPTGSVEALILNAERLRALVYYRMNSTGIPPESHAYMLAVEADAYLNQSKELLDSDPALSMKLAVMAIRAYGEALKAIGYQAYNQTLIANSSAALLAKRLEMMERVMAMHNASNTANMTRLHAANNTLQEMLMNMTRELKRIGVENAAKALGINTSNTAPYNYTYMFETAYMAAHAVHHADSQPTESHTPTIPPTHQDSRHSPRDKP